MKLFNGLYMLFILLLLTNCKDETRNELRIGQEIVVLVENGRQPEKGAVDVRFSVNGKTGYADTIEPSTVMPDWHTERVAARPNDTVSISSASINFDTTFILEAKCNYIFVSFSDEFFMSPKGRRDSIDYGSRPIGKAWCSEELGVMY